MFNILLQNYHLIHKQQYPTCRSFYRQKTKKHMKAGNRRKVSRLRTKNTIFVTKLSVIDERSQTLNKYNLWDSETIADRFNKVIVSFDDLTPHCIMASAMCRRESWRNCCKIRLPYRKTPISGVLHFG